MDRKYWCNIYSDFIHMQVTNIVYYRFYYRFFVLVFPWLFTRIFPDYYPGFTLALPLAFPVGLPLGVPVGVPLLHIAKGLSTPFSTDENIRLLLFYAVNN